MAGRFLYKFLCPRCDQKIAAGPDTVGMFTQCPTCAVEFQKPRVTDLMVYGWVCACGESVKIGMLACTHCGTPYPIGDATDSTLENLVNSERDVPDTNETMMEDAVSPAKGRSDTLKAVPAPPVLKPGKRKKHRAKHRRTRY